MSDMTSRGTEALDFLAKEYVSKCKVCDECVFEITCILHNLKNGRKPDENCYKKIIGFLFNKGEVEDEADR